MQTLRIGKLKASFSEVLKKIRSGQKIVISYGKCLGVKSLIDLPLTAQGQSCDGRWGRS